MRTWIRGVAVLLLWAGVCQLQPARESLLFDTLSIEQGLSQSIVECMIQDRRGFLWLGTEDGLNRYDGSHFTVFKENPTVPNSLSHDNILCLLECRNGWIWIGTYHGGLNRYDTEKGVFKSFRHDPERPDSLCNDVVNSIAQDGKGILWVGTPTGLDSWDKESGGFVHAGDRGEEWNQLGSAFISALKTDREGHLWIGTAGAGLFRLDADDSAPRRLEGAEELSNDLVFSICEDRAGRIWVGTLNSGALRWDPQKRQWHRFPPAPGVDGGLGNSTVRDILMDHSGTVWLATDDGLHRYLDDRRGFAVYRAVHGDPRSIATNEIHSIFEDRGGVLWVGTYGGGVSRSVGRKNHFLHIRSHPDDPNGLSENIVWSFWEDERGYLWVGTHGGGLDRMDPHTGRFIHFRHRPGDPSSLSDDRVRVVMQTRDGMFWLGTNGGGLNRFNARNGRFRTFRNDPDDDSSLSFDVIRCILEDSRGFIWVGTLGGGLNRMDRKTGRFERFLARPGEDQSIANNVVRVLYESPPGTLWIGTYGGGLDSMDLVTGRIRHLHARPNDPGTLSNNYVFSIYQDDKGVFWVGTEGGLNRRDPDTGKWRCFDTSNGLPDNTIYGILPDDNGRLWISTSNGLGCFDPVTGTCRNYHYVDGLQNNEFNGGAYYRNSRGELFFGGINGFNIIDPARIEENRFLPPVVITDFRKFNQAVDIDVPIYNLRRVELSHRDDMVTFGFAALDFNVPSKNQFAYRMEGLSDKWIKTGADQPSATFTSLPPGNYVFRVKASNNHGVWNHDGATVHVRVRPPWWKTWWFQLGLLLVALITIVASYRLRIGEIRHETRLRAELQAAHDAQASIMPCRSPRIPGFDIAGVSIPASEVGGDFFDYLWTGDGHSRFAVAVGDVSGKGMKAAMTAVMADGILSACAARTGDIGDIMARLNFSLTQKTDRRDFVAMLIAAFDGLEMEYINSGLPDGMLKRDKRIQRLAPEGIRVPTGVRAERVFSVTRRMLEAGDVLVFMSDGVTEAMDGARRLYGRRSLEDNLESMETGVYSAREILNGILEDVRAFMADVEARDDMTVVVVKVK